MWSWMRYLIRYWHICVFTYVFWGIDRVLNYVLDDRLDSLLDWVFDDVLDEAVD